MCVLVGLAWLLVHNRRLGIMDAPPIRDPSLDAPSRSPRPDESMPPRIACCLSVWAPRRLLPIGVG